MPDDKIDVGNVTSDEMVARARTLLPILRERAEETEKLGNIPAETMEDFRRLGLLRMSQPHRYGGYEMGWDVQCEIGQLLAAADCSQAWIQRIIADHAQMVATFPAEAQEEVWADDHDTIICASFEPVGRATPVEGGFRFSGTHGFASGIDYADWLICGGFIIDGDKRDGPHFFLARRSDATIIDDWDTMGLEGTGSKSFVLEDVFIPAYRFLDGALAHVGKGPGTDVNTATVYRIPRGGVTPTGFAAMTVGTAQGVLEEWLRYTGPRKSRGVSLAADPGMHMIAARSSAEIAAAESLYLNTIRDAQCRLEAGETLSAFDLSRARRNVSFSTKLALKAGTRLFNAAGGRAIMRSNALERQYRNLLASASHFATVWERNALIYGKELLERSIADAEKIQREKIE
ncbi:MAG: hypothetical protein GKS01_00545 [Alphaproteobacteria bacterium]|nr:hypothetical protein [Alphaproteobacteria bacterium]